MRCTAHPAAAAFAVLLAIFMAFAKPASAQGRTGTETAEDSLFKKAEESFNVENYANAAALYDQVIKLNPARVDAFVKRATIYFSEHNYAKAIELLSRAEKLADTDLGIKTVLGLCFYEGGQKERGLSYLEDVIRQRPSAYQAQFQIGKHYLRLNPPRAIAALENYLRFRPDELRPKDFAAQLLLGTAYYLDGDLAAAERLLEQARTARPKDNQIRQTLGTLYIAQGRFAQGAALYEAFRDDINRRPAVAFNLATCYLQLGRREQALPLAEQYHALRKEDPRGLLLLAEIQRRSDKESDVRAALGKYKTAEAALRQSFDTNTRVNVSAAIARTYLQLHDAAQAVSTVEPALRQARVSEKEQAELIAVLIESRLSQMEKAQILPGAAEHPADLLPLAERLLARAPGDAWALTLAGSAAYAAGDFDRARQYFTDARALDDKLPRARRGLARTLEQQALFIAKKGTDRNQAIALLVEAQKLDERPSGMRNLAALYLQQGHPEQAEQSLQPLTSKGSAEPAVWLLMSRAQAQLGKADLAVAAAERAVEIAARQLVATDSAKSALRQAAVQRLAEAQIELSERTLQWPEAARDKLERSSELLTQAIFTLRDVAAAGELRQAAEHNRALLNLRLGQLRLFEVETQVSKAGVSSTTIKAAEEALLNLRVAIEPGALKNTHHELGQALCLATLAAIQAQQWKPANELLHKASSAGCELRKPFSRLGNELLATFLAFRSATTSAQREQLVRTLHRLQSRISGPDSAPLLRTLRALLSFTHMTLAYEYHQLGRLKAAAPHLLAAKQLQTHSAEEDSILAHNLAVLELDQGQSSAERTLERMAPHPPEALLNLGILQDRRGQPRRALELYRKAAERGAKTAKLREWIDTKERILGLGGTSGTGGASSAGSPSSKDSSGQSP